MNVPITSDLTSYQAYWTRVLVLAFTWAGLVLGLLIAIVWKLWRG